MIIRNGQSILPVLLIVFCLSLFCSCASRQGWISAEDGEITAEEILDHIRYLASDKLEGRRAGTEGAEKAAQYIAREFKRYGLEPVGDEDTY